MNNFWRALIAGYGAKKLGGGCLSTIIIFIVIYYALGVCNKPAVQPKHADFWKPTHLAAPTFFSKSETTQAIVPTVDYIVHRW